MRSWRVLLQYGSPFGKIDQIFVEAKTSARCIEKARVWNESGNAELSLAFVDAVVEEVEKAVYDTDFPDEFD